MADKIRINSKFDESNNYEPSDSENEYSTTEKQILDKLRKRKHQNSDSEEEVYAFSESEADSEGKSDLGIADSDLDGAEKSDDDLPDSKAWGKKKKSYYSTDYVDEDYGGFGDDEEDALMEEEEAKSIQKRLLEQLGEDDFTLEFFNKQATKSDNGEILIKHDVSQMSKREKLQLFEKESPEFSGLIEDFKLKLTVAKDDLHPVLELVKGGKLPSCSASKFVKTNYDLILNYCTNISFYLLLKSQKINIQNHPVIKRLYQYRQLLKKMEPIYIEVIKPQVDKILNSLKNNLELQLIKENKSKKRKSDQPPENPTKKLKLLNAIEKNEGEDTGVSDYDDDDEALNDVDIKNKVEIGDQYNNQSEESGFSDNDEPEDEHRKPTSSNKVKDVISEEVGDKRQITYQIAKNKGLTPHRKKEQRNPRVKHKLKYRKAKIRRKGAVREPRTEITRYGGEPSGIKANVKKSIKIK
ncbi:something about silencing protein 10 [Pararge aegeria]|uniref:Jg9225 protein n=2 Tax=Pararge aegeria TaxID=116150 RepID=A0A8S4SE93_9NEOP|nr:something about silencing protein 10 [Pararge aegeria]CAH2262852.1 jg9225 [Pararge aegeria aegeria]